MPFYNVSVSAYCDVFVEAKDEEEAQQRACDEVSYGDFQMDTGEPARELKTAEEIERYKRHAGCVLDAV